MAADLTLQQTPKDAAAEEMRERLVALRLALSQREAELAQIRAEVKSFEDLYLRQVGILYAELDALDARIAEREVDLYDSDSARRRAKEARQRAQQTHDAAFSAAHEAEEFEAPPNLKTLFREVAKRIHPDFAGDEVEQRHFTLLMIRANQAYRRGDVETLQRLLDDHLEINASEAHEGVAAEVLRMTRQIQHAERDLAALDMEQEKLLSSEIGQLHLEAKAATGADRDLLEDLAMSLREQIADAQRRFDRIDQQIGAHGR